MQDRREEMVGTALVQARRFLHRWRDAVTRSERDDLAQDVAVAAMQCSAHVRDRACFPAMVRTISRRLRWQVLERVRGDAAIAVADESEALDLYERPSCDGVRIRGEFVPMSWMLEQLDSALDCVGRVNRQLLLAFHAGSQCAELSRRFELSEDTVKVRLYRSRLRLREEFEGRARAAGYLVD
jgi:DNA-directed RNA polymerase specialized sigma24 family protein